MAEQHELNAPLLPEQAAGDQAADQPEHAADDLAANQQEIEEADHPEANQQEIEGADQAANQQGGADPIPHPLMWEVYHNKPVPPMIYNFAMAFQLVVGRGDTFVSLNKNLYYDTVFDSSSYKHISMENYLIYIHNIVQCSDSCYIHAYSYLDRLANSNLHPPISSRNAHMILLTAIGLGIKAIDGEQCSNRYFATVGQVSHSKVNEMVRELLIALEYKVDVPRDEFMSHKAFLEQDDDVDDEEEEDRKCCCCFSMYSCFN